MPRCLLSLDTFHCPKPAATVFFVIRIDKLLVNSFSWQTNPMTFANDRREVANTDNLFSCLGCDAPKREHILGGVIHFDPLKTARITVGFPQRGMFRVNLIQILNQ